MLVHRQSMAVMAEVRRQPGFANGTPTRKMELMQSALFSSACSPDAVLLRALFDERNAHIRDRVNRQIEESISASLRAIIEEGVQGGFFQVVDTEAVLEFVLHLGEIMIEAVHARRSEEQLTLRLKLVAQMLDALLGLKPRTMSLTLKL